MKEKYSPAEPEETPSRSGAGPSAGSSPSARWPGLALLLAVLLYVVAFVLYLVGPQDTWDSPALTLALNTVLVVIPSFFIAALAARGFAYSGIWPVLGLGAGAFTFGFAVLLSNLLRLWSPLNAAVTDFALLAGLAGLFSLLGALFLLVRLSPETASNRRTTAAGAYLIAAILIALITLISARDILPPFFIAGQGTTGTADVFLGLGAVLFFAAGIVVLHHYMMTRIGFIYWYGLGLLLMALLPAGNVGLAAFGTPFSWVLRAAQLLGGLYFFVAGVTLFRQARAQNRPVAEVISQFSYRTRVNYELVVEQAGDAIVTVDDACRILMWNPAAARMFGYTRSEAAGMAFVDLAAGSTEAASFNRAAQAQSSPLNEAAKPATIEITARRKNGEVFPIEITLLSQRNTAGRFSRAPAISTLIIRDVTARKQAEAENERLLADSQIQRHELLAQAEDLMASQSEAQAARDRYLELYDQAPVGYLTVDAEGVILESNLTAARLLGVDRNSLIKYPLSRSVVPDHRGAFLSCLRRTFTSNAQQSCDMLMSRRDGSQFYAKLDSVVVASPGGLRRSRIIISDITALKQVENELRESEERFAKAFNASQAGIALLVPSGQIVDVNEAFERITGYSRQEAIGRSSVQLDMVTAEFRARLYKELEKKKTLANFELQIKTRSGDLRTVLQSLDTIELGGQPHTLSMFYDITDRKKAEEELLRTKGQLEARIAERTAELEHAVNELAESNAFNVGLLENSPVALIVLNPDASIRYANPQVERLFGYPPSETAGRRPPFPWWPESKTEEYNRVIQSALRGTSFRSERLFIRQDGEQVWTETAVTPVVHLRKVDAVLISSTNISASKQLRDELELYNHRVIQAQETERHFIARELHEQTLQMVALLKMELDSLLQSLGGDQPKVAEKLRTLLTSTDQAMDDIRRFSYTLHPAELEHLGLETALEKLCEDLRANVAADIKLAVSGEPCTLGEDKDIVVFRIAQEALNNIRRHARASHISVNLNYEDSALVLVVQDDGAGFDLEKEPQFALERGRLGLIDMRERAKLIGAALTVDSQPGKGTTITLRTPA